MDRARFHHRRPRMERARRRLSSGYPFQGRESEAQAPPSLLQDALAFLFLVNSVGHKLP